MVGRESGRRAGVRKREADGSGSERTRPVEVKEREERSHQGEGADQLEERRRQHIKHRRSNGVSVNTYIDIGSGNVLPSYRYT